MVKYVEEKQGVPQKKEALFLVADWKQLVKNVVKDDNKQDLELVVAWVGVDTKPYYAKIRDEAGNVVKDDKGNVQRSKHRTGWTATFVQFGTGKIVRAVFEKNYSFEPTVLIKITGRGYEFKKERSYYIDENADLEIVYDFRNAVKEEKKKVGN